MKTEITIAQWRENLKENSKFHNFWSSVSNVRVAKTACSDEVKAIDAAIKSVQP
jgi:hypothetical protein